MTNEERAYLAGLVDGEGCITCVYGNTGIPQILVAVAMNSEEIIKYLESIFGGVVTHPKEKPVWEWRVNGANCKEILEAIKPYSRVKRRAVNLGLAFVKTMKPRQYQGNGLTEDEFLTKCALAEQIRSLTSQGVRRAACS